MFAGWKYRHDPLVDPVFRRWFDGSVVVEPDGAPKVVYHGGSFDEELDGTLNVRAGGVHFGTKAAAEERILAKYHENILDDMPIEQGEDGRWYVDEYEWPSASSGGFSDPESARTWAAGELNEYGDASDVPEEQARIVAVYLQIRKPLRVRDAKNDWAPLVKKAKAAGHDGLIYKNEYEGRKSDFSYVVFSPTQVKSVNNRGTFDPTDPHVLHGLRGRL